MLANLNGWHAAIIVLVILLLFGAPKIPALARSIGQSLRILKTEVGASDDDRPGAARPEGDVDGSAGAIKPVDGGAERRNMMTPTGRGGAHRPGQRGEPSEI